MTDNFCQHITTYKMINVNQQVLLTHKKSKEIYKVEQVKDDIVQSLWVVHTFKQEDMMMKNYWEQNVEITI